MRGFPLGESCQRPRPLTDEGRPCRYCPQAGCRGARAPHPALRATFPWGKALRVKKPPSGREVARRAGGREPRLCPKPSCLREALSPTACGRSPLPEGAKEFFDNLGAAYMRPANLPPHPIPPPLLLFLRILYKLYRSYTKPGTSLQNLYRDCTVTWSIPAKKGGTIGSFR